MCGDGGDNKRSVVVGDCTRCALLLLVMMALLWMVVAVIK
jgi:hypothetical protein